MEKKEPKKIENNVNCSYGKIFLKKYNIKIAISFYKTKGKVKSKNN